MIARRSTPVTIVLIAINVAAFLYELATGALTSDAALIRAGVLVPQLVLQDGQWWRIVTSAFLHAGYLHIGVNMFSLWVVGRFIESIAGSLRTFIIYAFSLVVSGIAVTFLSAPNLPTLGASGAIFGLFAALFAIGLKLGKPGMQLIKANIGILILNLIFTFAVPDISWQGHVGGLVAGFVLTYVIYFPPRRVRARVVDASTGAELESEVQPPPTHGQ